MEDGKRPCSASCSTQGAGRLINASKREGNKEYETEGNVEVTQQVSMSLRTLGNRLQITLASLGKH